MRKLCSFFWLTPLLLLQCGPSQNSPTSFVPPAGLVSNSRAQRLNNIVVVESGGLHISRAYLTTADGAVLNTKNRVTAGQTVTLNLVIKDGWMAENGRVSVGASLTVHRANSDIILESSDLFAGKKYIEEGKASHLQLDVAIKGNGAANTDYIVVYHVWDKMGEGAVEGSYPLSVPENTGH